MSRKSSLMGKHNFFIRSFILYLLIILLPIMLTWALWTRHSAAKAQRAMEDAALLTLKSMQRSVDNDMKEIHEMSINIHYDAALQAAQKNRDAYSRSEVIAALKRIVRYNSVISEIILVFPGDEYLYSSGGTFTEPALKFYAWGDGLPAQVIRDAVLSGTQSITFVTTDHRFIFQMEPLGYQTEQNRRVAVFGFTENYLEKLVDTYPIAGASDIFIYTQDGQALYTWGREELYGEIPPADEHGFSRFRSGGKGQVALSLRAGNGWVLCAVLPAPLYFWDFFSVESLMTILMIALVIACAILAYSVAQKQSAPLDQLAMRYTDSAGVPRLTTVGSLVNYVMDTHDALSTTLSQQTDLLQDQMLYCLFDQANTPPYDELRAIARLQGLPEEGSYQAAYLHLSAGQGDVPDLPGLLAGLDTGSIHVLAAPMRPLDGYGMLLFSKSPTEGEAAFLAALQAIVSALKTREKLRITIGVGAVCRHLLKISHSFGQARLASEYQLIFSNLDVIPYEMVKEAHSDFDWLKLGDLVRFSENLRSRQGSAAQGNVVSMIEQLRESKNSPVLVKCMCSEIISQFLRAAYDMHIDCQGFLPLFRYDSLSDLEQKLIRATEVVCASPVDSQSLLNPALFQRIQQYITANLSSYDLSLSTLSEATGYSTSYTGRIVKAFTGKTFTDYVAGLRIEYVCKMLSSSDLPVHDIIAQAGYSDTSSFNRKFKSVMGITPTEYRKRLPR